MTSKFEQLSSFKSEPLSSKMVNMSFKQFKRSYPGNYSLNFSNALSSSIDFKHKNYTNFYLTNNIKIDDSFEIGDNTIKSQAIYTNIRFGTDYLTFVDIDSSPYANTGIYWEYLNYKLPSFTDIESDKTKFTIEFKQNNICNIHTTINYKKYYLLLDSDNKLVFVDKKLVNFDENSINPQDFKYIFSEDTTLFFIFKINEFGNYFITKDGSELISTPLLKDNTLTYISRPFSIDKNVYTYPNISSNTSYITYTPDNNIDPTLFASDLSNNLLLHKTLDNNVDIIVLKNQVCQNDVFTSGNNLLSGGNFFVDGLRNYTCIAQDSKQEQDDELELSYVFYNQNYNIESGSNVFKSPSSMYPFTQLNINDTKFKDSGAFAHNTPEYADKVYSLSEDNNNYKNGQYLLCTWLSGNQIPSESVWVDRYYYPDLVSKEEALVSKPYTAPTYENYIESIINNNIDLKNRVGIQKVFDKKSDMVFQPDKLYRYDRLKVEELNYLQLNPVNSCVSTLQNRLNYFKDINKIGKFTFGGYFSGDESSWTVQSKRNSIPSGFTIVKNGYDIYFKYEIYDESNGQTFTTTVTQTVKKLKRSSFHLSIDSIDGLGYFYLNDGVIGTFSIPAYQFSIKQVLYGDISVTDNSGENDIYTYSGTSLSDLFLFSDYIPEDMAFLISISNGGNIDNITITLPCGMRNSSDNIQYLNSVCDSTSFKSNNINIHLKNMGISNEDVLNNLKSNLKTSIDNILPVNTRLENIIIENYK